MRRVEIVAWWLVLATSVTGCGTLTWPWPLSRASRSAAGPAPTAAAAPSPAAAPAPPTVPAQPVPPAPPSGPTPLTLAEQVSRLSDDLRAMEATLANAIASSRQQEDRLHFLERRLADLEGRPRGAVAGGALPGPASGVAGRREPSPLPASPVTSLPVTVPPEELYAAATARIRAGETDAAILKLYELITAHPFHPLRERAQLQVADILIQQKDLRGAKSELENLLVAVPAGTMTSEALLRMGTCERGLGDEAKARAAWERVIREYPTSAAAEEARSLLAGRG